MADVTAKDVMDQPSVNTFGIKNKKFGYLQNYII